ncbi:hypothetical protein R5R35_003855 [Gryllus longicercus]|uniref:Coiled-coil domain-containing protein 186 n=1 Tax=Gryllus longicercus TaxID=2509291 RepID=A0AAN9V8N4_9ORTH
MSASDSEGVFSQSDAPTVLEDAASASSCHEIAAENSPDIKRCVDTYDDCKSECSSNSNVSEISNLSLTDTEAETYNAKKKEQERDKDDLLEDSMEEESGNPQQENKTLFAKALISQDDNVTLGSQSNSGSVLKMDSSALQENTSPELENLHSRTTPNGFSDSILHHPAYKTLIQEITHFKEQVKVLQNEITRLECENQRLEADRSHEIYVVQLETLEKTIAQQQNEIQKITLESRQQAEIATKSYNQMKKDLEGKLQKLTKDYDSVNADKDSMVMSYVVSEKKVMDLQKAKEGLEKKLKESVKEREILVGKMKSAAGEKARICQMLDNKCHELTSVQKENEKMKDDLNSLEIKLKWVQNKLKTETETHKETQRKVEKLVQKLQECREETEQVRHDCQETMRAFQESEDNKAYTFALQLKEQQAKLIMERHEREGKEETYKQLLQEVDNLKKKNHVIIEENNILSVKVQNLEKERLEYEQNVSKYKRSTDKQHQDIVDLQNQVTEMEALKMQLQHGQEKVVASQAEVERLRNSNEELLQEMAMCREREAELLDFTQKLTEKNVRLQSEFSATEAKAQQLEYEQGPLQRRQNELEAEVVFLKEELQKEQQQRLEESSLLARHLAERTNHAENLARQVEDLQGEIEVIRRKDATRIKELTRELQQYRKKEASNETSSSSNSLNQASRTSSSSSLNTLADGNHNNTNGHKISEINSASDQHSNSFQVSTSIEPDRQMLIERIVQLQRSNARQQEKIEFLEEHSNQLTSELQKKKRIVQNYILREREGALSSETMDQNKLAYIGAERQKSKAEVVKHGGIMASLYGSKVADSSITLELSLEINKKLQAVLEDTLLKNITLKENIDTLGTEIARLTMQKNKQDVYR